MSQPAFMLDIFYPEQMERQKIRVKLNVIVFAFPHVFRASNQVMHDKIFPTRFGDFLEWNLHHIGSSIVTV